MSEMGLKQIDDAMRYDMLAGAGAMKNGWGDNTA